MKLGEEKPRIRSTCRLVSSGLKLSGREGLVPFSFRVFVPFALGTLEHLFSQLAAGSERGGKSKREGRSKEIKETLRGVRTGGDASSIYEHRCIRLVAYFYFRSLLFLRECLLLSSSP